MTHQFIRKSFSFVPGPGTNPGWQAATFKSLWMLCLLAMGTFPINAQDSVALKGQPTCRLARLNGRSAPLLMTNTTLFPSDSTLPTRRVKSRVRMVAIANMAGYSAILMGLNKAWYSNYHQGKFHSFNDNEEWLQVDKVGHLYGAYIESRTSMELWRWTGIDRKKRIWLGGLSGAVYQTAIEILDGFSTEWGWSWGDFGANLVGSGSLIAQELAWDDQRIKIKFSFHKNNYTDPQLNNRADKIFGKTYSERLMKDYNAQTYWASVNLSSFFPQSNLPPWLAVAVGYGVDGMFGARGNTAKDENDIINFDRKDIKRYRQWYLSPDIDFTKIKTNKKGMRILFTVLSAFKLPAPSLEFSKGRFKVNALHF